MLETKIVIIRKTIALIFVTILTACSSAPVTEKQEDIVFPKPPDEARFFYQNSIMSDQDVVKESENAKIQRWLTGIGKTGKPMSKPYGIAVRNGTLYVADPPARLVHQFDFKTKQYREVGKKGAVSEILQKPFGVAVDQIGNLYVVDRTAGNFKIYGSDGEYLRSFGDRKDYDMPTGIAVSLDGQNIYISDTGGVSSKRHRILVYHGTTGELVRTFATRGSGDAELNLPKGIALHKDNELYVVDSGNFRIVVFDAKSGKMLRTFGSIGRKLGQFSRPKSIATCSSGLVLISDAAFGNIQIFNQQGQLLMFIGDRGNQLSPAKYMLTSGVACDEDGRLYVADQFFRKVDIFRPVGLDAKAGLVPFVAN